MTCRAAFEDILKTLKILAETGSASEAVKDQLTLALLHCLSDATVLWVLEHVGKG